ncbi:putative NUDIX family NTP pyrophosphohydrolase [Rhizobium sp. BK619]|nr:putative NUDIX family NTP pyrophosphohydrolase [Rhizobium sp. BK619]
MADYREAFIGIDVAKLKNAIAVAEPGGKGEIRFWGEMDASDSSMRRINQRIAAGRRSLIDSQEARRQNKPIRRSFEL